MTRALACVALIALLAGAGVTASGADFTSASASPVNVFATAADFNTVAVTMTDPGAALRGTVALQASASSERGVASVRYERSPAGAGTWTDACLASTAPFSCDFETAGVADGVYDLRAVAVDQAGYMRTSDVVASRRIDNTLPAVALSDPGAYMTGIETLTATGSDAGSGLASLAVEYRPAGGSWTTLCSGATSPRSCALDTAALADGSYELRARAIDAAGNVADATLTRVVDTTAPSSATLASPGSVVKGTVALTGTAADAGSGIAAWTVQYRLAGGTTWTDACSDATASYGCSWTTTGVADATYDLRAVARDQAGNTTASTVISSVRVDNTAPQGTDVQATNGGATAGRLESADTIRFTYSEAIAPASILAGWTGASQAIRVYVTEAGTADTMDFRNSAGTTRLNLTGAAADLGLNGDFVSNATVFNATMAMSGSTITVTLGSRISGTLRTAAAGTMTWRPAAAALDVAGNAAVTTQVTESGAADRDF